MMNSNILKRLPVYNKGERKEYLREETDTVVKDLKLRFYQKNIKYRFGPYKMEISSHRILLFPENLKEGKIISLFLDHFKIK